MHTDAHFNGNYLLQEAAGADFVMVSIINLACTHMHVEE